MQKRLASNIFLIWTWFVLVYFKGHLNYGTKRTFTHKTFESSGVLRLSKMYNTSAARALRRKISPVLT